MANKALPFPAWLTQAYLHQHFVYDSGAGALLRRDTGKKCEHLNTFKHRQILIQGRQFVAHRLIWLMAYGKEPTFSIDHINGKRDDNRLCNLREATDSQNCANRSLSVVNRSGFKGVSWKTLNKKWVAQIQARGKKRHLGLFDTKEEAHAAYVQAATTLHGEFANFGSHSSVDD